MVTKYRTAWQNTTRHISNMSKSPECRVQLDYRAKLYPVYKGGYRPSCRISKDECTMIHPCGSVTPQHPRNMEENDGIYTPRYMKDREADLRFLTCYRRGFTSGSGATIKTTSYAEIYQQNPLRNNELGPPDLLDRGKK